jgi:hypothetical protein
MTAGGRSDSVVASMSEMSSGHNKPHRRVGAPPPKSSPSTPKTSQRDLVIASLMRCPDGRDRGSDLPARRFQR